MQTLRGFSFPTYLQLIPTHFRRGSKIAFTCKLKVIQLAPSFTNINILIAFHYYRIFVFLHYSTKCIFDAYMSFLVSYLQHNMPPCRHRLTSAIFSMCLLRWSVAVWVGSRHLQPPSFPSVVLPVLVLVPPSTDRIGCAPPP